jgi:glutathione S-transferase
MHVHDGFGLAESSAMVEYLDEVFPSPPVLPPSAKERARCRQIMSWLRSDETAPIREERATSTMFFERHRATRSSPRRARRSTSP